MEYKIVTKLVILKLKNKDEMSFAHCSFDCISLFENNELKSYIEVYCDDGETITKKLDICVADLKQVEYVYTTYEFRKGE